jgi:hypothetical protein
VPKTPTEFVARWKSSENYARLQMELEEYESRYPVKGEPYQEFLCVKTFPAVKEGVSTQALGADRGLSFIFSAHSAL